MCIGHICSAEWDLPFLAQMSELRDGGLFARRALPLSPVSADFYVRSGLEPDSSKMSQAVAL